MLRSNVLLNSRLLSGVICLAFALVLLAAPAAAAGTTQVNVTKYCDNNYSTVDDSATLNLAALQSLSSVYSNGPVYMQKGTFDSSDVWGNASQGMSLFYVHNGTYVRNITDQAGGMSDGDEVHITASDGYGNYFGYDNVYTPDNLQGDMILAWWDDQQGFVPDYSRGMRLFFYTPPSTYGVADSLNMTLNDMKASFDPWYQIFREDKYNPGEYYPVATGLSVQYVSDLDIYPPHRYDFNTTGDTTEWAYEGGVGSSPGVNDPSGTTVDTSKIADDDGVYEQTSSSSNGEYAAQRFVFNVTEDAGNIEKLAVTWDGTSSNDNSSADQGTTTYIWKSGTGYETLSGDITSGISDYIVGGNVTVLVKQNAPQSTVGVPPEMTTYYSHIATDYVKLVVTHHHSNS